ncbi:chromosome partitioning protein [Actinoplanes sp. NPDC049118]|uniref:MinD/ParA family ATP-binding protein n=1 Tax=Actinoplanes sp. NPDC049118 TaxID=3155769 RepID=UPI0033DA076B
MEDENADRVYVPGTNGTPPDRDVEPFWPPEELSAPVHGGRPVPRDAPPAFPLPPAPPVSPPQQGDPAVYRPTDRAAPPQPAPPVYHQQMPTPQAPRPQPTASPDGSAQPWPNIPPRPMATAAESGHFSRSAPVSPVPPTSDDAAAIAGPDASPVSGAGTTATPISGVPASEDATVASDSPWAQPPQRPAPAPPAAERHTGPENTEPTPRAGTSASVPGLGAAYYPAVTPRQSPENADAQHPGAVYRPGPVGPEGPRANGAQPAHPESQNQVGQNQAGPAVPQQRGPRPGPAQPGPGAPQPQQAARPGPQPPVPVPPQHGHPGMPHHQGQAAPGPTGQAPHWAPNGQAAPMPPGPYPPAVDPRAARPHPQVQPPVPGEQPPLQPPPADPYQQLPWVSDGTPTAEEFARRRLAKPAEPTATMGARAMLQKGTMGLVRLAPGKREQEYKQDVEMVRRNFGGLRQVTVVNPKGGAGKTVAVLLLAMTFGQKRGGYVLAWDNNETQGTLGMRAQQDFHARTVRDMMRDLQLFRGSHGRVGDLSQYVRAQGEGMFDVLASDESATAGEMLTASAFAEIREIVSRFYKLIFVDTGNNVRAQNWQAAMDATDQLVITMSARNDSAETAARMLDHLEQSGRQRLVRQAVSVVTMPPTRKDIDLPAIQRHFAARTRAVLLAPYEKLIDSGEPLRYGQLSAGTRDSWLKIAAAVAEGL